MQLKALSAAFIISFLCLVTGMGSAARAAEHYQVNHGATVAITEHTACAVVTNNNAASLPLFVPTKAADEWTAFRTAPGTGVTSAACDTTPAAFTFVNVTGVNRSTLTTAASITINGINTTTPVSVTGTGAQISINGGTWTTSGTITNGQTLAVRLTSSGSFSTALSATVNVGGVTNNWSVTTRAANSCSRPWGGTIAHGSSVTAYAAASVPCGGSCSSQSRSCNDGVLSGSYTKASCAPASCYTWTAYSQVNANQSTTCSPSNPAGQACSTAGATCRGLPTKAGPMGILQKTVYRCE